MDESTELRHNLKLCTDTLSRANDNPKSRLLAVIRSIDRLLDDLPKIKTKAEEELGRVKKRLGEISP